MQRRRGRAARTAQDPPAATGADATARSASGDEKEKKKAEVKPRFSDAYIEKLSKRITAAEACAPLGAVSRDDDPSVERAISAVKTAFPRATTTPAFRPIYGLPRAFPCATGFIAIAAKTGRGKTVTLRGIELWLNCALGNDGSRSSWVYAYEPGSKKTIVKATPAEHKELVLSNMHEEGVCVFDSLHQAIGLWPGVAKRVKELGDTTFEKGLKRTDMLGATEHQDAAFDHDCALIASVNPDTFPPVDVLAATITGYLRITRPGVLYGSMRPTRTPREYVVPTEFMERASVLVLRDEWKDGGAHLKRKGDL